MKIWKSRTVQALLAGTIMALSPLELAAQETEHYAFDIPAQDLGDALRTVAATADWELYAAADEINGVSVPRLRGAFTAKEAIERLLQGTALVARFDKESVLIEKRSGRGAAVAQVSGEAIVVTGTRIEGAPPAAPVITITNQDIKNSGLGDLGEVARSLPQNFGGGQNPGVGSGQGNQNENVNTNGASTFNLRGIGPNATLTLLNGNRFAYSGTNSVIDVSAIPVAAVERIEIVTDGASAIYGADAVAGVVNILLRKDYEGFTTTARLGGSTDGGNFQQQFNALGGTRWSGGGLMATYDYFRNGEILARERSYTTSSNPASTLYPELDRHSFLLSGHHEILPSIKLSADTLYKRGTMRTMRGFTADRPVEFSGSDIRVKFETVGVAPTADIVLSDTWTAHFSGFYGTDRTSGETNNFTNGILTSSVRLFNNRSFAVEAAADGSLFALPAGDVRVAVGGGWRRDQILIQLSGRRVTARRDNSFAYGELFVPLASPEQDSSFAYRASVTAAVRWEDYSDSGSIVTPKLGLVFAPTAELSLGVSWGRSFKMPTLLQQYNGYAAVLLPVTGYGDAFPTGANYLYVGGQNPNVGPERSENISLSATFRPSSRLQIVPSLFRIDYRDRVAPPFGSILGMLTNPTYASLVTFNPSSEMLDEAIAGANGPLANITGFPYDPSTVIALLDGRDRNIAEQRYEGADLSLRYRAPLGGGRELTLTAGATWLDSQQRLLPTLPITDLAGTIFNPPHFRARGGASFSDERFTLASFVNFTGSVTDRRRATPTSISSMATLDLTGRIKIGNLAELSLSALNVFNAKPDQTTVASPGETPFDSTNYSAIGRFLSVTLSRNW